MPGSHHAQPRRVRWMKRLESATALDRMIDGLARLTAPLATDPNVVAVLRGRWLGHAVHPALTDLPLGAWASTTVLDLTGGETARPAAQRLLGLGILSALPTAVTGWSEWAAADRAAQRVGVAHAASNSAALGLYGLSWIRRRRGHHRTGVLLGLAAGAVAVTGGYLGGHLTEVRKVASYHPGFDDAEATEAVREQPDTPDHHQPPHRAEFHVSPENEIWKVEHYGHNSSEHASQQAAVAAAREQADRARPSRVVIHGADGFPRDETSYDALEEDDAAGR